MYVVHDRVRYMLGLGFWVFGATAGLTMLGMTKFSPSFTAPAIVFVGLYVAGGVLASSVKPYFEPSTGQVVKPFRMLSGFMAIGWLFASIVVGSIWADLPVTSHVVYSIYVGVSIAFVTDTLRLYSKRIRANRFKKGLPDAEEERIEGDEPPGPEPRERERHSGGRPASGPGGGLAYCQGCGQPLPAKHVRRDGSRTRCPYCGHSLR
ncbi:MAG: hypothetical protein JXR94_06025 [Candidatus Hydrogenedentes bacterium]|nr:hypothetical protein [Candidatus Hydrogenedentota bacterium]